MPVNLTTTVKEIYESVAASYCDVACRCQTGIHAGKFYRHQGVESIMGSSSR
jgi:hypothetical protein